MLALLLAAATGSCSDAAEPTGDLADADGVSPLEHARSRGFDEIAAILEAGMATRS